MEKSEQVTQAVRRLIDGESVKDLLSSDGGEIIKALADNPSAAGDYVAASRSAFEVSALVRAEEMYKLLRNRLEESVLSGSSSMEVARLVRVLLLILDFERSVLFPRRAVPQLHVHTQIPEYVYSESFSSDGSDGFVSVSELSGMSKKLLADSSDLSGGVES